MLDAEQDGVATVTFIAKDSNGLSDSASLSVRVNAPPTLSGIPEQPLRLLEGMNTSIDVTLGDANADDILTIAVESNDTQIATVNASGNGIMRTLEIVGVGAGNTTITVTVNDGRGVANSQVSATICGAGGSEHPTDNYTDTFHCADATAQ